jgi:DNA-directed RNA polymerase subunit E"
MEKLKACRKCKALVPLEVKKCPVCGGNSFTKFWRGMLIVIDPDRSEVARITGIQYPGMYAIAIAG